MSRIELLERIDGWGRLAPDRVAHVSGDRRLTYGELRERSEALAGQLAGLLDDDRSPIAVVGHKEPEMLVAFLAAVKAGHPYVPIDTSLPEQRRRAIVAASGARLTLGPDEIAARSAPTTASAPRAVGLHDPFYVIFTSGSTGEPKGVVITAASLTFFVDWMLGEHAFSAGEVFLDQAPFSFDLSVMDLYPCLARGGTLASLRGVDVANPLALMDTLERLSPTVWVSTPSFARMCLGDRRFQAARLPGLGRFLFCGETLAPAVAAELLLRFPAAQVWNTYGPTEATVATTSVRIDQSILSRGGPLPIGVPAPGSQVIVVDENLRPVADGERGELVIAGPNVSVGYHGRADMTELVFFHLEGERAFHTGDTGYRQDGQLYFEGRANDQVKVSGYRIELGDVEANLRMLPGVQDAVVVKDADRDRLTAHVILADGRAPGASNVDDHGRSLRAKLAERLPAYMLPARFHFVLAFPMTANGKADRAALARRTRPTDAALLAATL